MLKSFDYVAADDAEILILGSMPGKRSLDDNQYYAHPKNIFWDIMGMIFNFIRNETEYQKRLNILENNKLALWDVVSECRRKGSLDSDIEIDSIILNDLEYFINKYKKVKYIIFNGRKAEALFKKKFLYLNIEAFKNIRCITMPSTSPANASIKKQIKIEKWFQVKSLLRIAE